MNHGKNHLTNTTEQMISHKKQVLLYVIRHTHKPRERLYNKQNRTNSTPGKKTQSDDKFDEKHSNNDHIQERDSSNITMFDGKECFS